MSGVRTFDVAGLTPEVLVAAKRGRTISLCIPCRNEAATVGPIVSAAKAALIDRCGLLDELIVLDDRSTDATAGVAARAGATVISIDEVHEAHGRGSGKGNALWATLLVSTGDVIVWCDGDITTFSPDWIVKLAAPLLLDDTVAMVKPIYERPTDEGGGGRTTELVARPLLRLYAPELAALVQPLAGEYAVRRTVIEQIPLVQGWGAEIAMILDLSRRHGPSSIAQVCLGVRRHRHRSLEELSVQATEVMAAALERLDVRPRSGLGASPQAVRPPSAAAVLPHTPSRR
jgi:glucosyl-3-phosphoglycerate synthase